MKTLHESFAEKYRAKRFTDLIGQETAIETVKRFINEFPKKQGLILHGPAGTGKTSLVLAAAKENNLEVFELNSSDLRNKKKLEEILKPASEQMSLFRKGKLILMDEIDGVTGTDIGGVPELVRILEETKHPIIMTCNDAWQTKLAPVRKISAIIEMKALSQETIIKILKRVAVNENLIKEDRFFQQIALKSQGDLRAALNDLQAYSHVDNITVDTTEKRDLEENIFNILKALFKERNDFLNLFDNTKLSLDEILLWIEENIPREYKNEALAKAYKALGEADIFRGRIYKNQHWRFLLYQNIFQSAGISYAKSKPSMGFTKYESPKRILKIWMNNQNMEKKKTIARKLALHTHCSYQKALQDYIILKHFLKNPSAQKELKLSEEEIEFVNR